MKKADHQHTDEIVCPYCDYKFSDSWEYDHLPGDGDKARQLTNCHSCRKEFFFDVIIETSYTTERKEDYSKRLEEHRVKLEAIRDGNK